MFARAQTFYLFAAALLAFSSMFFPFWYFVSDSSYALRDFGPLAGAGALHAVGLYLSSILSPLVALLAAGAALLYKNRALQSRIILLLIVLFLGDILTGLLSAHFVNIYLEQSTSAVEHAPGEGLFMLLPEPLLFWLALKGVKKDEKIATAYKRL